jgi:hypothetical protein
MNDNIILEGIYKKISDPSHPEVSKAQRLGFQETYDAMKIQFEYGNKS